MKRKAGFTLVELIIYIAIFAMSATFLTGVLSIFVKTDLGKTAEREVNDQISFSTSIIQQTVRSSSLIELDEGKPTEILILRRADLAKDPTRIYKTGGTLYLEEGGSAPVALTNRSVNVDSFLATKFEHAGGSASVRVDLSLSYNSTNPNARVSRAIQTVVTRISAATFDSDILPNMSGNLNLGNIASKWQDGYFSGRIGIGSDPPVPPGRIKTVGDVVISDSSAGLILKSPNGTCFRVFVSDAGVLGAVNLGAGGCL